MERHLGRTFPTIVRSMDALKTILASDPYRGLRLRPQSKRVVTFLRDRPTESPGLPMREEGAVILRLVGREVYTVYLPTPRGPVFMALIERAFGQDVTTRSWDTVRKVTL